MSYDVLHTIFLVFAVIFCLSLFCIMKLYSYSKIDDLAKTYDGFMSLVIEHNDLFQQENFYVTAEADFNKRVMPGFNPDLLIEFLTKQTVSEDLFTKFIDTYAVLTQHYKIVTEFYSLPNIPVYKPTHKAFKVLAVICFISGIISYFFHTEYERELLKCYNEKGIESLDDRYETVEGVINNYPAKIISKIYKSGKYELEVFETHIGKTSVISVPEYLYKARSVNDSVMVRIDYKIYKDKFKDTEKVTYYKVFLAE